MALILRNAAYVVCKPERIERNADVLIEGNRIAAIGHARDWQDRPGLSEAATIDARDCAVIPGLVNSHTHLYQNFIKGLGDGLSLVPWCNVALFPTVDVILPEMRAGNTRLAYLWTALASIEMIRGGITCCQDHDLGSAWEGIVAAWRDIGIRGVGAITLADRWIPANVQTDPAVIREQALAFIEAYHDPHSRITMALGPSTVFACSDAFLTWAADIAAAHDLGFHIHVSETAGEVAESLASTGLRPPERLARLGILSSRLSAAHCVHVNPADIDLLARSGAAVVHCPKSNMKLADGIAPIPGLRRAGVRVALATDGAASNDLLDMWEDMRAAALLARVGGDDAGALSAGEAFGMATLGGAQACRVEAGAIEPGRLADLAIVELRGAHLRPIHDLLTTLVFCARAADVRDTIVDGRIVMRDRRLLGVDEAALIEEADAVGRDLLARRKDML